MASIFRALSLMNFFKVPVRLKIDQKDFYSSKFGEFLSIVIIGLLLFSLATNDVFYKESPETYEKSLTTQLNPLFSFTKENFFIALVISNKIGITLKPDPTIFSFKASYITSKLIDKDKGLEPLPYEIVNLIPCLNSSYYGMSEYMNLMTNHKYAYCLPFHNFSVEGNFEQQTISWIRIGLDICVNSSALNKFDCKPQSEIDEYLKDKHVGYALLDNQIHMDDFSNPIKIKITTSFKLLETKIRKRTSIYLEKVGLTSDSGFFFEEPQKLKSWKVGEKEDDFLLSDETSRFEILLFSSNVEHIYSRRYKKIQNALANLGGILNFLVFSGFILMRLIPFNGINFILSNHLFSFRQIEKQLKRRASSFNITKKMEILRNHLGQENPTEKNIIIFEENEESQQSNEDDPKKIKESKESSPIEPDKSCMGTVPNLEKPNLNLLKSRILNNECFPSPLGFLEVSTIGISPPSSIDRHPHFHKNFALDQSVEKIELMRNFSNKTSILKTEIQSNKRLKRYNNKNLTMGRTLSAFIEKKRLQRTLNFSMGELGSEEYRNKIKEKLEMMRLANKTINEQLDVMSIFEKLQEVDKLKLILFNPQQLLLFDLISKPEIYLEEKFLTEVEKNEPHYLFARRLKKIDERLDEDITELFLYYEKIKECGDRNNLDGRLFELLDDDLKKFLDS